MSDDELAAEMQRLADESNRSVGDVARQVAEGAGLERLRSDIRSSKAVEWLLDHVEVVDEQGNPMDRALLLEHEEPSGESDVETTADAAEGSTDEGTTAEAVDHDHDTEEGRA